MARDEVGAGGILVALMAGAVLGAAVALLFAPATGGDTRRYLNDRVREGRDRAAEAARRKAEAVNRVRQNLAAAFDRARQQAQPATEGPDA